MKKVRSWCCGRGHVMGVILRNGRKRGVLALYAEAVDPELPGHDVEVRAILYGKAADIRCSVCGEVRDWYEAPLPSASPQMQKPHLGGDG